MRKILFKAKRIDNGEWVEGQLVKKVDPLLGIEKFFILEQEPMKSLFCWYKVVPDTVCQFTGLTDKNGVKIWEGDNVVCKKWIGGNFVDYATEIGYVEMKFGNSTNSAPFPSMVVIFR